MAADVARAPVALHISRAIAAGTIALRAGAAARVGRPDRGDRPRPRRSRLDAAPGARPDHGRGRARPRPQTAVTRRVDVFDPAVITITRISGGTTNNIIPDAVEIEGTIRTVSPDATARPCGLVHRVAAGIAAAHGATIDLEIVPGYPVTMNDPDVTAWVRGLAVGLAGEDADRRPRRHR